MSAMCCNIDGRRSTSARHDLVLMHKQDQTHFAYYTLAHTPFLQRDSMIVAHRDTSTTPELGLTLALMHNNVARLG